MFVGMVRISTLPFISFFGPLEIFKKDNFTGSLKSLTLNNSNCLCIKTHEKEAVQSYQLFAHAFSYYLASCLIYLNNNPLYRSQFFQTIQFYLYLYKTHNFQSLLFPFFTFYPVFFKFLIIITQF